LIAAGVVGFLAGEHYRDLDYLDHFRERRGRLLTPDVSSPEPFGDGVRYTLTLRNDRGIEVEAVLKVPAHAAPPYPAIVSLGGLHSGRHAIEHLGNTGEFMVLAVDYPFRGKRDRLSTWQFVRQLPAMRRAVLDTPPATMLAIDYLLGRGDVDRSRVVLVGGSLGALFVPAAAAADDRATALAILFGAGDLGALAEATLDLPGPIRRPAAWMLSTLVSPVEPLKYIGRVAPLPVFLLNGTEDPRMPEQCSVLLQQAARDPKTVRWMPVGHVSIRDPEFRREVRGVFLDWLVEIEFLPAARARELASEP
jgi:dienelactone hydrolase